MTDSPEIQDLNALFDSPDIAAPKRATTPKPRAPKRATAMSAKKVKELVMQGLITANLAVFFSPYSDDALNDAEIDMLASAIATEFETYPALQSLLQNYSTVAPHLQLAYAIAAIAYPRMVRHGIMPAMSVTNGDENPTPQNTDASPVEAGRALGSDRGYWNGQDNVSSILAVVP